MQASEVEGSERVFGPTFFIAMFGCLVVATQVLVPFSAFLSMGSEWDENTFDLLVLSNLRPRQVILGKVLSAAVQALLFYSAFGPFLVFAFLLRGVDLMAIAAALGVSMVGSILASCVAVAMSSFSQGRFARLVLMVLLASALVQGTIGMIAWSGQLTFFPAQLHDTEYLQGLFATISIAVAVSAFFFSAACARLAHAEENRSTGLRVMVVISIFVGLAWMNVIMGRRVDPTGIQVATGLAHAALAASALFFTTEPERLGRRVASMLPKQRWKRLLQLPFLPGGARGVCFFVLMSLLISLWAVVTEALGTGGWSLTRQQLLFFPALLGYGWLYLVVPSAVFSFHSDQVSSRVIARVVILVSFVAGHMLPALIGFLFGIRSWANFEHPFNVFLSLDDLWSSGEAIPGTAPLLGLGLVVGLALSTPRFLRSMRELMRSEEG
jgi:hypothetical protein